MSAWPLFELVVTTPRLSLRIPQDDELMLLSDLACGNVVDDQNHRFLGGWTKLEAPEFQHSFLKYQWQARSQISPGDWHLLFAIFPEGQAEPAGMMGLTGSQFIELRKVLTGSWVLLDRQGEGLGKEARAAALHLAFEGLGANEAQTQAMWPDNKASNKVSLSLGYDLNGNDVVMSGEGPVEVQNYRLQRERFVGRDDIKITGLKQCLPLLGLDAC
jgi:RimJ/RimL family protein N-acetyltransferase